MSNQHEQIALDDVLDAFMASVEYPDHAALTAWVRRYPQYAQELTEFAASWGLMEILPPVTDNDTVSEETRVLRGLSIVQNILHEQRQSPVQAEAGAPLSSLISAAKRHGMSAFELADRAELSAPLISKLDRRLIIPASIPSEAHIVLADALQQNVTTINWYLQQPPIFAPRALHHSKQAPVIDRQEDFFDAIRKDLAITEERRQRWMALAPRER
jgi:hypothetical protein